VATKRTPDLLIKDCWCLEFKIVRPFGDNGTLAEDWSVNLLHPYAGIVSAIGDCLKLLDLGGRERKAVCAIGFEHTPPMVSLDPLFLSFEVLAREVVRLKLSERVQASRQGLVHPVHQQLRVAAWEVLGRLS